MQNQRGLYPEQILTYTSLHKPLSVCRQQKKTKKQMLENLINAGNNIKSCQESNANTSVKVKKHFPKQIDTEIIEPIPTIRMFNHTLSNFRNYAQRIFSKSRFVKTETTPLDIRDTQKSHEIRLFNEIVYLKKSLNSLCRPKVCKLGTEASHLSCQQTDINKSSKIQDTPLDNSTDQLKWKKDIFTYTARSQMKKKIANLRERSLKNSRKKQLYLPNSLFLRKQ